MTAACVLLVAVLLDTLFGEPPNALHPVAWMGTLIAIGRDWAMPHGERGQWIRGLLVALAVPMASAAVAFAALRLARPYAVLFFLLSVALSKPLFAIRALETAAFAVRDALAVGDIDRARSALGSLCSRKAESLDESALIAATVESVAENTSDSIVAPFFYFALLGVPGAAFYRASNTADAMIGYHGRYEWVGKAAARLDDLLNLIPARLTALLLLASAGAAQGSAGRGLAILLRDGGRTESPNAGRPMAAMAGLLGIRLEKEGHYALGDATRPLVPADITRACKILRVVAYEAAGLVALALVCAERYL